MKLAELDRLIRNVDRRAKMPRHFELWSEKMMLWWLHQHQRKETNEKPAQQGKVLERKVNRV